MFIEAQEFLSLAEAGGQVAFVDIEATGLNGDYNSVLVVSAKPYGKDPITLTTKRPGDDAKLVREARDLLEEYSMWVTYYGKGFDIPMLDTRLLVHGEREIQRAKHYHLDMYYTLKSKLKTSRKSQGHLLSLLGLKDARRVKVKDPETGKIVNESELFEATIPQKMTVSAEMWNRVLAWPKAYLPTMVERCESDVTGLEALYDATKHLIREVKRG